MYHLDSTYQQYHMIFVFLFLISLSIIISWFIHVAANGTFILPHFLNTTSLLDVSQVKILLSKNQFAEN